MAVTVDWTTYEIQIPKADTVLVTASPDVRSMTVTWLFDQLVPMMDDEDDMSQDDKFRNTAPVTLGGTPFGRVLEILSPYTVTFEAGNYAVNITDGSSNINDVATVNGVSIRSQGISVTSDSGWEGTPDDPPPSGSRDEILQQVHLVTSVTGAQRPTLS